MSVSSQAAFDDPSAGSDPRIPIIIILALACIAAFYWSAVTYYFDGSYLAPLSSVGDIFGGLIALDPARIFNFISLSLLLFPIAIIFRLIAWVGFEGQQSAAQNLFNDSGLRNFFFEMLLLAALGWLFWSLIGNAVRNLAAANIASGFGFLDNEASFGINFSPILSYSETDSYGWVYFVGLQNTLLIAIVGILLATILGFVMGVARLSTNWVISQTAYVFVEIMRNIPLLLWIFIWYFSVLRLLPDKRNPLDLGPLGFLNVAGYYAPKFVFGEGAFWIVVALVIGIIGAWIIARWAKARQMATGQQFPTFWASIGLIVGLPFLVFLALGAPLTFEMPTASRFGPKGGARVIPEYMGLLVALVTYTAAYIAEIVRAGILAISKGQSEASHALGIRQGPTLRLVIIPQAMRVIIPPMTNQYLNLTKNSSLAVAIAYPDLVSVFAGTALNQTGQAVEILLITMLTYLTISLATSMFMNWFNARMALVER
ncbi:MAG: amino acid ABC transporter permease [Pseudomonadota bacterium]